MEIYTEESLKIPCSMATENYWIPMALIIKETGDEVENEDGDWKLTQMEASMRVNLHRVSIMETEECCLKLAKNTRANGKKASYTDKALILGKMDVFIQEIGIWVIWKVKENTYGRMEKHI